MFSVPCFGEAGPGGGLSSTSSRSRKLPSKVFSQFHPIYLPNAPYGNQQHSANPPASIPATQQKQSRKKRQKTEKSVRDAKKSERRPAEKEPLQSSRRTQSGQSRTDRPRRTKSAALQSRTADAVVPQHVEEILYEDQLVERRARSLAGLESTRRGWEEDGNAATELIFMFERHGDGWGEEIFPHLTVEKRPISVKAPSKRNRGQRPDPWEEGSPEWFLKDHCEIPEEQVDIVMTTATAWRVTAGGRPLIDRRRRSRVARNVVLVCQFLEDRGVSPGREGVGKLFVQAPKIMLCKPYHHDRWDRRAIELAHFLLLNNHCNVSEEDPVWRDLGVWVKRQRVAWQQGHLASDRLQILSSLGLEVGIEAQITEDWELKFDQLVEWILKMRTKEGIPRGGEWATIHWGAWGGVQGRQCCTWVQLQRELRKKGLLPMEAVRRLDLLKFPWEMQGGSAEERQWLVWLGSLAFSIERAKNLSSVSHLANNEAVGLETPLAPGSGRSYALGGSSARGGASKSMQPGSVGELVKLQFDSYGTVDLDLADLQEEVAANEAALQGARLEPGLAFWLARQRRHWRRRGRLSREQGRLLALLGVSMDTYSLDEWRHQAHAAAAFLLGSQVQMDLDSGEMCAPSRAGGSVPGQRLRVARWVMTQQALLDDQRLSKKQLRYITVLELAWLINRKELAWMQARWVDGVQIARLENKELSVGRTGYSEGTRTWLRRQHALSQLGWLDKGKANQMAALGLTAELTRTSEELAWDQRMTELLAYRRKYGTSRMPVGGWNQAPKLAPWLIQQQDLWSRSKLSASRVAQLCALDVEKRMPWQTLPDLCREVLSPTLHVEM